MITKNNGCVLVTGGSGYIGSHTLVELIDAGFEVLVLDNFSNSSIESLNRVKVITGRSVNCVEGDIRNKDCLRSIFSEHEISAVIHFAGLKAVGESNSMPLSYYDNNVSGTVSLCQVMSEFNCQKIVFSSSATVYGDPEFLPINEDSPLSTTNPYGRSKLIVEDILRDLSKSKSNSENPWSISLLRYFNPVGAHESGLIGEDPRGIPNNLMPYISQVASGTLNELGVFGDDYSTPDGTGVRDYIHVVDLAKGHLKALNKLLNGTGQGCHAYNLGTGTGVSVLEAIKSFEAVNEVTINYAIKPRREGDVAECFADASLAERELGWKAELTLSDMVKSAWYWQENNPNGYL